jgi:vancomycin resistance protein YoaR
MVAGIAVTVVLAAAGAGIVYALAPEIPRGLRVLGIAVGGRSKTQAAQALRAGLGKRVGEPFRVRVSGLEAWIRPVEVGLRVDVAATVDRASARDVIGSMVRGREIEPVVVVDGRRLVKALKGTTDRLGTPMTLPRISYEGLVPKAFPGVPGNGLDLSKTAETVARSWLREPEAVLPVQEVLPESGEAEVGRVLAGLAVPAVAKPVRVRTGAGDLVIRPEQIAASLVIDSDVFGKLTPHVDEAALRAAMKPELELFEVKPRDAGVAEGHLTASAEGMRLDTSVLARDLMAVLPRVAGEERMVEPPVRPVAPRRSTADLAAWGVAEQVSAFTTHFSGGLGTPRSNNIVTGAGKLDGVIVRPGETFSLNGFTGPRGYAEGYKDAPIIVNGRLTPGVGGGLSQLSTTLFNAAYYAGMADVEHHPHSIYFPQYPSVIESTIFYPSLDLKFRNDGGFAVLIDTSWTEDSITVSMWSTKVYESVTTEWGPRHDFTEPEVVTVPAGQGCIAREGAPGFAQEAWRLLKKRGEQVRRDRFGWRYDAEPRVTCA